MHAAGMRRFVVALGIVVISCFSAVKATAADGYFLRDDGSRWLSSSGQPVRGLRKSSQLICKQGRGCYGIHFASRYYNASSQDWGRINRALAELAAAPEKQIPLDPSMGERLYRAAEQGYQRWLRED